MERAGKIYFLFLPLLAIFLLMQQEQASGFWEAEQVNGAGCMLSGFQHNLTDESDFSCIVQRHRKVNFYTTSFFSIFPTLFKLICPVKVTIVSSSGIPVMLAVLCIYRI